MTCTVNLVPVAHLSARARLRHRAAWVGLCAVLGIALASGWSVQRIAAGALRRLSQDVLNLDTQRTDVQRRLQAGLAQRDELLGNLQAVAGARCPQPWPHRLATLTRTAPDGVFLTNITIAPPDLGDLPRAPRQSEPRPAGSVIRARQEAESEPREPARAAPGVVQTVRMLGYALNHGALLQFVNALQDTPGWKQVDLVRATQEPFQAGLAVAFELECHTGDERP